MGNVKKLPFEQDEYMETELDPFNYENNFEDEKRRSILLSFLDGIEVTSTLDLGCGSGFVTKLLPGSKIVGIDSSATIIRHLKADYKNSPKFQFESRNIMTETIVDLGRFDLIVCTGTLYQHYLGDNFKIVHKKIIESLNPGGFLVSVHILEIPHKLPRQQLIEIDRYTYNYREYTHEIILQRKII